ncbi:MAG: TIGR03960 family B12-binding radical SAM protein [Pseudomonadota bacterium]
MSILDQPWFYKIRRPSRYMGNEINSIKKDLSSVDVSIALAFPDLYEVGMSHLGLKLLYHILNNPNWLAAERVFCPWTDLEKELRERAIPLSTIESCRPLREFDIIGFSLQHELTFTNVLTMLDLSGISFLSERREHLFPLIIAGGPACFNPEPIAPIFDAMVIGDGEEAALEICKRVRETKSQEIRDKKVLLRELANIRGVYVPAFFNVHYGPEGILKKIEPILPEYREIKKAVVPDIDLYPFPAGQVVPYTELVHDRLAIEISRGCTRGCRFCQAGMIYRPVRERNPRSVIEDVEKALSLTGFEELSFLSLSSGDYSCIGLLLEEFMDRQSENRIAISLPSLRVDSLDPVWFEQIKRVRKTGFTLAPEVGNDRLRALINKSLSSEDILNMARKVYEAGWNLIKLYFMIGLPTEGDADLHDIIHLAREVASLAKGSRKKARLNVSIATFVPKSHTPFMWVPQITLEESRRRTRLIQNGLRNSRIRVKWNQPEMSWLEGIFSRGDRRLVKALIEAFQMGARFDAWSEHFKMELWKKALERSGLEPEFYLHRPRSMEEVLPWDHIQSGITKGYLKKEWTRALEQKKTPDCRKKCLECGVCDHERIDPVIFDSVLSLGDMEKAIHNNNGHAVKRYRITFCKTDHARYLSHLELVRLFIRAFKRAHLKFAYSKGYHPMPKVSFFSALPVGMESLEETIDIELLEISPPPVLKEKINQQLPPGIKVLLLEDVSHESKKPRLLESHYCINMEPSRIDQKALEGFLHSDYFPIIRSSDKGEQTINARLLVKSMSLLSPGDLKLIIKHSPGPEVKPVDIIKAVFHLNDEHLKDIKVLKSKQVVA